MIALRLQAAFVCALYPFSIIFGKISRMLPRFSRNIFFITSLFILQIALFGSCVSSKKIIYFSDIPDTLKKPFIIDKVTSFKDPTIESNDLLSITLMSGLQQNLTGQSPMSYAPSGTTQGTAGSQNSGTSGNVNGYLVDKDGYIDFPMIGKIKLSGLTTTEARDLIKQKEKEFFKDPIVNVRFLNFEIYMLGDVTRPGVINVQSEKINIIDAIIQSGDLQISGRRDNILLIRSEGDRKIFARYDISSDKVFENPYYYLKQRDIIYVEPNKYKVQGSDQTFIRNLGVLSSLISLASLLLVFKSIK